MQTEETMEQQTAHIPKTGGVPDRLVPWALLVGGICCIAGFLMAFLYAAPVTGSTVEGAALVGDSMVTGVVLISQKIFYLHMPVAIASFIAIVISCYYGIRFLASRNERYDTCAACAMQIAFVFVICTMITGECWERFEWGVWWTWDARLTTYLVLLFLVIAYLVLRAGVDDPQRRGVYAAVVGILALVDVPVCYLITYLVPNSLHPVVVRDGGMSGDMALTVVVCMVGILLIAYVLYRLRLRQACITQRTVALQERIERREQTATSPTAHPQTAPPAAAANGKDPS
ncbi:MAG: cytochrome c biogenesis protein [Coriobacteriaceae bacterium]|nr:cytochrome c biogenesis protein [Coriobacteriaceae bacterium]